MGDLGDIGNFLKEGSVPVSDLSWLDVDEAKYRRDSVVPKQNIDIRPDLQALWSHQDKPSTTYFVPNVVPVPPFKGGDQVRTLGDMSQVHGPLQKGTDLLGEGLRRLARVTLMQSSDLNRLRDALVKRYDLGTIQAHRHVLTEVLQERGLLGKVYIAAEDFPTCSKGHSVPSQFVRKFAAEAPYVVAKDNCAGCTYAKTGPVGGQNCAVFHKEIVMEVPYTEALAQAVEETQRAKGKEVQATTALPKERIRLAMLAELKHFVGDPSGQYMGQGTAYVREPVVVPAEIANQQLIAASDLLKKRNGELISQRKAVEVVEFLKREMLKGLPAAELAKGLKLSFPLADLQATRASWEPVFKEAGLYGHVYSTQESFTDCYEGANFLAKHASTVRAIVEGPKCGTCIYHKVSRCMLYGRPVVASPEAVYTLETVQAVIQEAKTASRIDPVQAKVASAVTSPREALKTIHQMIRRDGLAVPQGAMRLDIQRGFYGHTPETPPDPMHQPEVVTAQRFLNEGLYGNKLRLALRLRFEPKALLAAQEALRTVLAEQGLQGIYYIDPSVYADYGAGCDEAMRLHRVRNIRYAKVGPKCAGCVLQTQVGFCSKLNKELVVEPPYIDKTAQQRAILAGPSATEVEPAEIMMRSNIMAEYEMQHPGGMTIDLEEPKTTRLPMGIEFNNRKINL
jgi:hypothetical protein